MASAGKGGWEQKLADAGAWAEGEVRRVVLYLNDEVVPEVRQEGSKALRQAAAQLVRLAEQMEQRRGPAAPEDDLGL